MRDSTLFKCGGLTIGLLATAFFGPASAAEPNQAPRAADVRYDDLNLLHREDVDRLQARVRRAARAVCSEDTRDITLQAKARQCRAAALESAQTQVQVAIAARRSGEAQAFNSVRIKAPPR
ncbi:MAG: UrcA family protein [Sphingobium sp.]